MNPAKHFASFLVGYDRGRAALIVSIAIVILCFLGGGASRNDVQSLLYVQPLACILSIFLFWQLSAEDFRKIRVPMLLLCGFAALHLAQLIPLPPEVWTALPGRTVLANTAIAAGELQPWRPISIAPDLTINSLVALILPAGLLAGVVVAGRARAMSLVAVVIVGIFLSAALGTLQLTSGETSAYHLYRITNAGSAVGLMANRNHQAALLAVGMPMLSVWLSYLPARSASFGVRMGLVIVACLILAVMIVMSGSRAGVLLAVIGMIAAGLLFTPEHSQTRFGKWKGALAIICVTAAVSLVFALLSLSDSSSVGRFLNGASSGEARLSNLPLYFSLIQDHFLTGSGFGTFDPLFRIHEPDAALKATYLNHAHNDFAELMITGGALAGLLIVGLIYWIARSGARIVTVPQSNLGRLGLAIIVILLIGSVTDYPLRTPLLSAIFALACGWLSISAHAATWKKGAETSERSNSHSEVRPDS